MAGGTSESVKKRPFQEELGSGLTDYPANAEDGGTNARHSSVSWIDFIVAVDSAAGAVFVVCCGWS